MTIEEAGKASVMAAIGELLDMEGEWEIKLSQSGHDGWLTLVATTGGSFPDRRRWTAPDFGALAAAMDDPDGTTDDE